MNDLNQFYLGMMERGEDVWWRHIGYGLATERISVQDARDAYDGFLQKKRAEAANSALCFPTGPAIIEYRKHTFAQQQLRSGAETAYRGIVLEEVLQDSKSI